MKLSTGNSRDDLMKARYPLNPRRCITPSLMTVCNVIRAWQHVEKLACLISFTVRTIRFVYLTKRDTERYIHVILNVLHST